MPKRSDLSKAAAALGRKGAKSRWSKPGAKEAALPQQIAAGKKLAAERGPDYYRELGKKGGKAKAAKRKGA